jgi:hypothetical protein
LQVGIETAARAIVRVRNIIAELWAFATDFASFSHDKKYLRLVKESVTTYQLIVPEKAKRIQNENL